MAARNNEKSLLTLAMGVGRLFFAVGDFVGYRQRRARLLTCQAPCGLQVGVRSAQLPILYRIQSSTWPCWSPPNCHKCLALRVRSKAFVIGQPSSAPPNSLWTRHAPDVPLSQRSYALTEYHRRRLRRPRGANSAAIISTIEDNPSRTVSTRRCILQESRT